MALQIGIKDAALIGTSFALVGVLWWNSTLRREVIELKQTIVTEETELTKIKTQIAEHTESITEITSYRTAPLLQKSQKLKIKLKFLKNLPIRRR